MIAHALKSFLEYLRSPAVRSTQKFADDIEEEIAFHLSERMREYVAGGMSEEEARSRAKAKFGNVSQVANECHAAAIGIPVFWHRMHQSLTAVLAIAALGLWLSPHPSLDDPKQLALHLPTAIASMVDIDWNGDITGQVLDEQGRPVESVRLMVIVKTWPDGSYFQRSYQADSDPHGRFLIKGVYPIDQTYEVMVTAVARNRALTSIYFNDCRGRLERVVLQLPPSSALALHVESETADALEDVEVVPRRRIEPGGREHLIYFDSAQSLIARTRADGRVDLPYFQPGDTASVQLRTKASGWQSREIIVPAGGEVVTIRIPSQPEPVNKES